MSASANLPPHDLAVRLQHLTQRLQTLAQTPATATQVGRAASTPFATTDSSSIPHLADPSEASLLQELAQLLTDWAGGASADGHQLARLADLARQDVQYRRSFHLTQVVTEAEPALMLAQHGWNVAKLVAYLTELRPPAGPDRLRWIQSALVHDVGMLQLPDPWLTQAEPWEDRQRSTAERHPLLAEMLLESLPGFSRPLARAVGGHHERLDQQGYPRRCPACELPALARLLAVADAYVARCEPRPYRPALDPHTALTQTLADGQQNRLDTQWILPLLNLGFYPVGTLVRLSTNETARVLATQAVQHDFSLARRPIVQLLDGPYLSDRPVINLAQHPSLSIVDIVPNHGLPQAG